jgi:hypothetical protein
MDYPYGWPTFHKKCLSMGADSMKIHTWAERFADLHSSKSALVFIAWKLWIPTKCKLFLRLEPNLPNNKLLR